MERKNSSDNMISMRSLTQALRARDVLRENGIRSTLVRTPGGAANDGCGYSLLIHDNLGRARSIISSLLRSGGEP